jgi:phenylacetate-CoA ligase
MARTLLDGGGAEIRPRLLIVNGEVLAASTRSLLSEAFGCEVRDSYGSVEFQQIAFECREGRLHVIPSVIVEADDETAGGDGYADILVTSLYHYTMPLIRYRLGDRVRVGDDRCRCGEGFGVIEGVFGRSDDFVTLAGGRTISARAINRLDDVRGVREYQIVQKTPERFEVLVTPGDGFDQEAKADIVDIIRRGCGDEAVTVEVITTDHIPRSKSGKLRAVVSEVS